MKHYWKAFCACAAVSLLPIWLNKYIPMVDLPQHATQIFAWVNYDNPDFDFSEKLQFNWFTPYLAGYLLARFFAFFMPVLSALKVVVSLAILGVPLAMHVLLKTTGRQRWWALLGFPAAYSFNFYWGLLNFMCAVPLVLLFTALAYSFVRDYSHRKAAGIALLALLLFLAHPVAFAIAVVIMGGMVLATATTPAIFLRGILPLLVPAALCIAWFVLSPAKYARREIAWQLGIERAAYLPSLALRGTAESFETRCFTVLIIALVLICAERPQRNAAYLLRTFPLLATLGFFFLSPWSMFGTAMLYPRFAAFLIPTVVLLARPAEEELRPLFKALIAGVVVAWLAVLAGRFNAFSADAAGFDAIATQMAPKRNVQSLIFEPFGPDETGAPVFQHLPAYYQAEKGGEFENSFFSYPQVILTYRPQYQTKMFDRFYITPRSFDWATHGDADYYVIRANRDTSAWIFRDATEKIGLKAQAGLWWLYVKLPERK
jgi:hypothetical protein